MARPIRPTGQQVGMAACYPSNRPSARFCHPGSDWSNFIARASSIALTLAKLSPGAPLAPGVIVGRVTHATPADITDTNTQDATASGPRPRRYAAITAAPSADATLPPNIHGLAVAYQSTTAKPSCAITAARRFTLSGVAATASALTSADPTARMVQLATWSSTA